MQVSPRANTLSISPVSVEIQNQTANQRTNFRHSASFLCFDLNHSVISSSVRYYPYGMLGVFFTDNKGVEILTRL